MNRLLIAVSCFGLLACGEINAINDAGPEADAPTGNSFDADLGPDATPPDPCEGPDIAIEDLEGCFRIMQCEQMVRCMPGFESQEHCEDRIFEAFAMLGDNQTATGDDDGPSKNMFRTFQKAVNDGVATYHPDQAFRCLVSLSQAICKKSDDGGGGGSPACEEILTGSLGTGDECFEDFECQAGSYCKETIVPACTQACCPGTCQPLAVKDAGCESQGNQCLPELDCVYISPNWTCRDGLAESVCGGNWDCKSEFFCLSGKCVPDWQPNTANCQNDDVCPGDQLCVPDPLIPNAKKCGDVDTVGASCEYQCWGNLYCNANMECEARPGDNGNCAALANQSAKCDSIENRCDGALCVPRIPINSICKDFPQGCEPGAFCSSNIYDPGLPDPPPPPKCEGPRDNGELCNSKFHCKSEDCGWNGNAFICQPESVCYTEPS